MSITPDDRFPRARSRTRCPATICRRSGCQAAAGGPRPISVLARMASCRCRRAAAAARSMRTISAASRARRASRRRRSRRSSLTHHTELAGVSEAGGRDNNPRWHRRSRVAARIAWPRRACRARAARGDPRAADRRARHPRATVFAGSGGNACRGREGASPAAPGKAGAAAATAAAATAGSVAEESVRR